MIKHIWSIICRRSIIDSNSNNLTISDVLETLTIDLKVEKKNFESVKSINLPLEFEIISFWQKEGEGSIDLSSDCQVEVVNPEGKLLQTFKQLTNMPSGMRRLRTILKVMGITIEDSGDYTIRVKVKNEDDKEYKTVAELPLEVHLNKNVILKSAVS